MAALLAMAKSPPANIDRMSIVFIAYLVSSL